MSVGRTGGRAAARLARFVASKGAKTIGTGAIASFSSSVSTPYPNKWSPLDVQRVNRARGFATQASRRSSVANRLARLNKTGTVDKQGIPNLSSVNRHSLCRPYNSPALYSYLRNRTRLPQTLINFGPGQYFMEFGHNINVIQPQTMEISMVLAARAEEESKAPVEIVCVDIDESCAASSQLADSYFGLRTELEGWPSGPPQQWVNELKEVSDRWLDEPDSSQTAQLIPDWEHPLYTSQPHLRTVKSELSKYIEVDGVCLDLRAMVLESNMVDLIIAHQTLSCAMFSEMSELESSVPSVYNCLIGHLAKLVSALNKDGSIVVDWSDTATLFLNKEGLDKSKAEMIAVGQRLNGDEVVEDETAQLEVLRVDLETMTKRSLKLIVHGDAFGNPRKLLEIQR